MNQYYFIQAYHFKNGDLDPEKPPSIPEMIAMLNLCIPALLVTCELPDHAIGAMACKIEHLKLFPEIGEAMAV